MRKAILGAAALGALAAVVLVWARQEGVPASQVAIGGKVANVKLLTLSGEAVELYSHAEPNGALVIFVATRCPVSNDYNTRMAELARDYSTRGFAILGINSNRSEPPEEVARHAAEKGLGFTRTAWRTTWGRR